MRIDWIATRPTTGKRTPFGGASGTRTGWGRIGGRCTMLDMTDLKTVVLDVGGLDQGNHGFPHAEKDPSKGDAGSAAAGCLFR